jgi:GT2 family glycosyltransferase
MSDLASVSIVMTYYERFAQLRNTLRSFYIHKYVNFEVIIVDDGSKKEPLSEKAFLNYNFPITVINMPLDKKYINPCVPFNIGFNKAKGDIVVIQNAECLHMANILNHVRNNLTDNNYLTYSCYSLNKDKSFELNNNSDWNLGYFEGLVTNNSHALHEGEDAWYNHSKYKPCGYHFTSAITRSNLNKLSGFDERYAYGIGYDDHELLTRIRKMGLEVDIVDDATVIHQWHYNTLKEPNFHALAARNELLYHLVTKKENQYLPDKKTLQYKFYKRSRSVIVTVYLISLKWRRLFKEVYKGFKLY